MALPFSKLWAAFEEADIGHDGIWDKRCLINRHSGDHRLMLLDGEEEIVDEGVEEVEDDPDWIDVPERQTIGAGTRLVFAFAATLPDRHRAWLEECFSRRGAYRRMRTYLIRNDLREAWFAFQDAETQELLLAWAREQGLQVEDDRKR